MDLADRGGDGGSEDHGRTRGKEKPGKVRGLEDQGEAADSEVRVMIDQDGARGSPVEP